MKQQFHVRFKHSGFPFAPMLMHFLMLNLKNRPILSQTNDCSLLFRADLWKKRLRDWERDKKSVCEWERNFSLASSRWPPENWTWQLTTIIIQHKWSTLFDICQGNLLGEIALCPSLCLSLCFCLLMPPFLPDRESLLSPCCICVCLFHSFISTP